MKRDLKRALDEYQKISDSGKGTIYFEDICQIREMTDGTTFEAIITSLKIGIALGYRIRKREHRGRR